MLADGGGGLGHELGRRGGGLIEDRALANEVGRVVSCDGGARKQEEDMWGGAGTRGVPSSHRTRAPEDEPFASQTARRVLPYGRGDIHVCGGCGPPLLQLGCGRIIVPFGRPSTSFRR